MDINELETTSQNMYFEQQLCCDLNAMNGERRSDKMLSISPVNIEPNLKKFLTGQVGCLTSVKLSGCFTC